MRFTKHFTTTTLLLTALVGVGSTVAQEPPAPPASRPPRTIALKMFVGNWTCTGTANLGPGKTAKIKATAKVKNELGGFWQSYVYIEQKTKGLPHGHHRHGHLGLGSPFKKFVRDEFQSNGDHATGTSTGWSGDTMTWDLEASNSMGKMSSRHSFIKKREREFVHKLEATMPGSPSPMTIFEVTCKK